MTRAIPILLALCLGSALPAAADPHAGLADMFSYSMQNESSIKEILALQEAPNGVVFEVYSAEDDTLLWALPVIRKHIAELRGRFPNLNMVVISHGLEEIALLKQFHGDYPEIHRLSRVLTLDDKVPLHIDTSYAFSLGVKPEQFPSHLSFTESGPDKVKALKRDGYLNVLIRDTNPNLAGESCPYQAFPTQ